MSEFPCSVCLPHLLMATLASEGAEPYDPMGRKTRSYHSSGLLYHEGGKSRCSVVRETTCGAADAGEMNIVHMDYKSLFLLWSCSILPKTYATENYLPPALLAAKQIE